MALVVAPGLAMIAVTYGLARFAYGLFVPEMAESFDLSPSVVGMIGAGSYAGYCVAVVVALIFTSRVGPRLMLIFTGGVAVSGMAAVAGAPAGWVLAAGILVAGMSSGLASPPMGEAVALSVPGPRRDRANALINSGTSLGVAISGPAALLAAEQWRAAWAAFAAIGAGALLWNALAMPRGQNEKHEVAPRQIAGGEVGETPDAPALSPAYLIGRRSMPLFVVAAGMGFASAAYWTFSRDLIVRVGSLSDTESTLFWTVIGLSGLVGGVAGDLVGRFGLGRAMRGSLLVMVGAVALLAAAPGVYLLSYASAALFGASYITLTGIILVWSVAVFPERPSAGLGAGFLLIALGQMLGAPVFGMIAVATDLPAALLASAAVATVTALVRPGLKPSRT